MGKNKIIILLIAVVMMGGVAACDDGKNETPTRQPKPVNDFIQTEQPRDTTTAKYYNELTQQYFFKSLDTALMYADSALKSNNLKTDKDTALYLRSLNNKAYIYFHCSRFDLAKKHIDSVKKITDKDTKKYKTEFWYYNIISMRMDLRRNLYDQALETVRENLTEFNELNINKTDAEYFLKAAYSIGMATLNYYYNSYLTDSIEVKLENSCDALGELLLVRDTVLSIKNPTKTDTIILESMNLYIDYTFFNIYMSLYEAVITDTGNNVEEKIKTAMGKVMDKKFFEGILTFINSELGDYSKGRSSNLFLEKAIKYIDDNYEKAKKYDFFHAQYQQAFALLLNSDSSMITPIINKGVKHKEMFEKDSILSFYNTVDVLFKKWLGKENMDYYQTMANNSLIGEYYHSIHNDTEAQKYFVTADSLNKKAAEYDAYNPKWEYDILKQLNNIDSANYYGKFRVSQLYNEEIIRRVKNSFDKMEKEKKIKEIERAQKEIERIQKENLFKQLIFTIILAGIIVFLIGWFVYSIIRLKNEVKKRAEGVEEREEKFLKTLHELIKRERDNDNSTDKENNKNNGKYYPVLRTAFNKIYGNDIFMHRLNTYSLVLFYFDDKNNKQKKIVKEVIKTEPNEKECYKLEKNLSFSDFRYPGILLLYACWIEEQNKELSDIIHNKFDDFIFNNFDKTKYLDELKIFKVDYEELFEKDFIDSVKNFVLPDDVLNAKSLIYMPIKNNFTSELIGVLSFQSEEENLFDGNGTVYKQMFEIIKSLIEQHIIEYDYQLDKRKIENLNDKQESLEKRIKNIEYLYEELKKQNRVLIANSSIAKICITLIHHRTNKTSGKGIPDCLKEVRKCIEEKSFDNIEEHINDIEGISNAIDRTFKEVSNSLKRVIKDVVLRYECFPIQELFNLLKEKVNSKCVTFSESTFEVRADRELIEMVLDQLIQNAQKHAIEGKKDGKIEICATEYKEKLVKISVLDNGRGIPDDIRKKQFDINGRFKACDEDEFQHGLYACYYIISEHAQRNPDCEMWLEKTEAGKGTTFSFTLEKIK